MTEGTSIRAVAATEVNLAARAMEAGELVVVPTGRWYMICCDASNADACARIFTAKQRPVEKSLLLVARSVEAASQQFRMSMDATLLAEAFWPGDLALLLSWRDPAEGLRYSAVGAPEALVTVAPGVLGELAQLASCPVAATSANISGTTLRRPSITLAEVQGFIAETGAEVPVVVDGGICPTANHVTIVRCGNDRTELVRDGIVHTRAIRAALGRELST
jgi:L-threonylcarbamoyladenylate synthase